VELSDGPIRDPLTPQSPTAEKREWADTPAAAPNPARLGRVTTGRGRPSARADRGSADWRAGASRHLVRRVITPVTASTVSRPPGMCDGTPADGMASLLATVLAVSERPVTLLLEELAEIEIRFDVLSRTNRELTASEHRRLDADPATVAHHRAELLRTRGGIVAAETGLVVLPQRLPAGARAALADTRIPLGEILAQFGARRLDRRALCRGACQDSAGKEVAVESLAVLAIGDTKVGITTERITGAFCRLATERSSL
jgi:chorismate-pyruvate lyase